MAELQRHHQGCGRKSGRQQQEERAEKATSWWNEEVKTAVRRKKELYNRALGEKNEEHGQTTRGQARK